MICLPRKRPILGRLHQAAGDWVLVGVVQLLDRCVASMMEKTEAAIAGDRPEVDLTWLVESSDVRRHRRRVTIRLPLR